MTAGLGGWMPFGDHRPAAWKRSTAAPITGKPGGAVEVEFPVHEALRNTGRLAGRMLEILIAGVSTRR